MAIKKSLCLLLALSLAATRMYCQVDSLLNVYAKDFYHEKIHVHFDRTIYVKGETIYYKAYLLTEDNSFTKNKNFYADWYDENGKLIAQTVAPIFYSGAGGSFQIPANYKGRSIELKAYTKWMLNFDTAFIYDEVVQVYQPQKGKTATAIRSAADSSFLRMYPEGGFSVAGLTNHVAFKATDNKGLPTSVHGVIKNSKGEIVDSISSVHDGMGSFDLFMEKDESYQIEGVDANNVKAVTTITAQKTKGLCLHVEPANGKAAFTVERTQQTDNACKDLHLLIHKDQLLYYKLDFKMADKTKMAYEITTTEIPDGIAQCTLFDKNWIPLAERIIFINNHKHNFNCDVSISGGKLVANGNNELAVAVSDTLVSNLSVAITDYDIYDKSTGNIFSDFLLSGDLRGTVYNPSYYVTADTADSNIAKHLDLLMLTQGHRQFDWEKIVVGQLPVISFSQDTSYLQIKGNLFSKKVHEYNEGLFVNGLLQTTDSVKSVLVMPVNKDGSFGEKNRFYYDTAKLFYSLSASFKKNASFSFSFENGLLSDSARQAYFHVRKKSVAGKNRISSYTYDDAYASTELNKIYNATDTTKLQDVIVTTKVKTPLQILDQYYARGLYAGQANNYAFDLEEDGHSPNYSNIFTFLESKVPGFHVGHNGATEVPLWYPSDAGVPGVPAFLLDETPIALESLRDIPINSLAYVKAFKPPFLGSMLNGFSGVIALYSKRGYSPLHNDENTSGLAYAVLKGYTKFKEFANDDTAAVSSTHNISPTVYWNPFILTDKNNQNINIEFYNNGTVERLCVVLEGIDSEGKLTRTVKLLE